MAYCREKLRVIYIKPTTHRILLSLRAEKDLQSMDYVIQYLLKVEENHGRKSI